MSVTKARAPGRGLAAEPANRPRPSAITLVPTLGRGSLDCYSRQLATRLWLPTLPLRGFSGSFNHPLASAKALELAREDGRRLRALRALGATVPHLTSHHLARYGPFMSTPYIVTVHDLIRYRDWRDRRDGDPLIHRPNLRDGLYLQLEAKGLRGAAALVAVSEYTKHELVGLLGADADRIAVVHQGVDHEWFRPVDARPIPGPYLLFVGSEHPRKNLATLLRAFRALKQDERNAGLKLVKVGAAGGPERPFRQTTQQEIARLGLEGEVLFAERVPEIDLPGCYSGALCLILPSLHEGFGLPPLEAMACGCPVVVSNAAALSEVAGAAAAVYGPPPDHRALAAGLDSVLGSERYRAELRKRGLRRASEFSWDRTAAQTRDVYRAVLRRPGPQAAGEPSARRLPPDRIARPHSASA